MWTVVVVAGAAVLAWRLRWARLWWVGWLSLLELALSSPNSIHLVMMLVGDDRDAADDAG